MDRVVARPRRTVFQRALLVAFVVVVLLGIVFLAPLLRRWAGAERVVDASRLRIVEVVQGDLERDLAVEGRVVAAHHPSLFSPAPGIVTLLVRPGAKVKKGQALAQIDSPELASRLAQERSTLLSLQSELGRQQLGARQASVRAKQFSDLLGLKLETATRALRRADALHDEGLLGHIDHDKAQDDLDLAKLELRNAQETTKLEKESLAFEEKNRRLYVQRQEAVVEDLARQVSELRVVAPFEGIVASTGVQDRDAVIRQQALLTLLDLTTFDLEIELPEGYAVDVVMGTRAEIKVQGKAWPGVVTMVSPEVRAGQVRATVAFDGDSPSGLRQSERLSTRLLLERRASVVKLLRGPFLESGGGRQAYVVDGGLAVLRPITTGAVSISEVEVVSGLSVGDRVIISDTSSFEGAGTVLIRE